VHCNLRLPDVAPVVLGRFCPGDTAFNSVTGYDMAPPCCQSYTDIRFCSATEFNMLSRTIYSAPHRTATGLWAPGPAHWIHEIARLPPQHIPTTIIQYSPFPDNRNFLHGTDILAIDGHLAMAIFSLRMCFIKLLFQASRQTSDIAIKFSNLDFLKRAIIII